MKQHSITILATLLLAFLVALPVSAQELTIDRFEETFEITASQYPRKDANGKLCALVKIEVVDEVTDVEGGRVGDIVNKGNERWAYITAHQRTFTVHFAKHTAIKSKGYRYSGSDDIDAVAWYYDNGTSKTHIVGQKQPNELGLYDMSGNVQEFCSDRFGIYTDDAQIDPTGPPSEPTYVVRGGGWDVFANRCTVTCRDDILPKSDLMGLGLRLALHTKDSSIAPIAQVKQELLAVIASQVNRVKKITSLKELDNFFDNYGKEISDMLSKQSIDKSAKKELIQDADVKAAMETLKEIARQKVYELMGDDQR